MEWDLERFKNAQMDTYDSALGEIQRGKKQSHWIWYIFPQIAGLGQSPVAAYYEIRGREEAQAYWRDELLSQRLVTITQALLAQEPPIGQIMGFPDDLKLRSCMTLFYLVSGEALFKQVLDKFFDGELDEFTVRKLEKQ